jgi:hypothetical protein
MKRPIATLLSISLFFPIVAFFLINGCAVFELQKISVHTLNNQLDNADLTIIDVRHAGDWQKSELKIKGAVHENPYHVASWADKYPKNKKIVLYCS